nr:ATP-binding protein [Halalkalibaculum roseum]
MTQQQLEEARSVYDIFWNSYQGGDLDAFSATLDDKFEMIGTSETERCHTKAGGIAFFKQQMEELIGNVEMRNRQVSTAEIDGLVQIIELCDIYTLAENNWSFYSKFRSSTLLRETPEGWKIASQHGSFPDIRVQEGETLAIDKIHRENLELRDAVKRRTAELENKTRELEIEAAIERVRVESMAMQHPDDLNRVNRELLNQLNNLQVEGLTGVSIWLIDKDGMVTAWDLSSPGNMGDPNSATVRYNPNKYDLLGEPWRMIQESGDDYFVLDYPVEKLEKAIDEWKKVDPSVAAGFREALANGKLTHQWNPIARHPHGILSIDLISPPSADTREIVIKMAGAFSLAYRRFLDLQKAEAQAREAQIIASMERVRAAAMAMHNSSELSSVLSTLFEQFDILGINPSHAVLTLINKEKNTLTFRTTGKNGYRVFAEQEVDLNVVDDWVDTAEKWKKSTPNAVNVNEYPPEILPDVWEVYGDIISTIPKNAVPEIKDFPEGLFITEGYCKFGYIGFAHHREPTDEKKDIVRRIAAEFGTLYQRFLDLQKAEAQTREAEIQLALERVRARTMAMQKSDELGDVIALISELMESLQIPVHDGVALITFNEDSKDLNEWMANEGFETATNFHLPYFDHPVISNLWKAREQGQKELIQRYSAEENQSFLNHIFQHTDFRHTPEPVKEYCIAAETYATTIAFQKNTAIFINDYSGVSLTDAEMSILHRFAKEFDQTYTRFLDLLKAEAQAREAQIETALERVRSRSMGMQTSAELQNVVKVIFNQLAQFNINAEHAGIVVDYKPKKDWSFWVAETQDLPAKVTVPYLDSIWDRQFTKAKKTGTGFFTTQLNFEEKNSFYKTMLPHIEGLTEKATEFYFNCPGLAISTAIEKDIGLYIENFTGTPYNEEENAILKRFAKVFQQTYTRFLDLQRAEAQAREAQIETALERVRSRSMAMHHTSELQQVIHTVHEELLGLGIGNNGGSFIALNQEIDQEIRCWGAGGTADTSDEVLIPAYDKPFYNNLLNRLKGEPGFFTEEFNNEQKKEFFKFLFEHEPWSQLSEKEKKEVLSAPGGYTRSCCVGKLVSIFIINHFGKRFSDEENEILKRFTKVFEQTYIRFLDLQKAEKQTREAQIETALEKVRSRSLAMHKSEELIEVVSVLFEKFKDLQIPFTAVGIATRIEGSRDLNAYVCGDNADGLVITNYRLPYFDNPIPIDFYNALEKQLDYFVGCYSKEEKDSFYEYVIEHTAEFRHLPKDILNMIFESPTYTISTVAVKNAVFNINDFEGKELAEQNIDIIKRFARVFDQAYTRFLDLQKAEEQAREAQIETALERVRSRTMAMQHSDELIETSELMFDQIKNLGIELWSCGFSLWFEDDSYFIGYNTGPDGKMGDPLKIPLNEDVFFKTIRQSKRRGDDFLVFESEGESLAQTYSYMDTLPVVGEFMRAIVDAGAELPRYQVTHCGFFSHGHLMFISLNHNPEAVDIFKRFTNVFKQTYTRFLDLQKAEKQAREAQIEAALERARAQSMMMQHSDEINSISNAFHEQLILLGIPSEFSYVWLPDEANQTHQFWASWFEEDDGEASLQSKQVTYPLDKSEPYTAACFEAWANPEEVLQEFIPPPDIAGFFDVWKELLSGAEKLKAQYFPDGIYYSEAYMRYGCFGINIRRKLSEEEKSILKRFSKEFERAYTRFLDLQKAEKQALLIREERDRLEIALNKLHATQDQLIQQEKLASLGQLTAGIAHEIKNPLNFVNNFSDVSIELIEEAREEVKEMLTADSQQLSSILDDIESNLRKIYEHGSRADGIVKSMLQHSRGGDGKMEPTGLNALVKEYANLAFHGMRAGNNPINVDVHLQLDENVCEIPLVAEDFSRVILNLCNNGFDAMREKVRVNGEKYNPKLTVRTRKMETGTVIQIEDNGTGIPESAKDKILQPFFTTKKGTQGTGLGLSITNDIVKAHGGNLDVHSQPGKTVFTIKLTT